MTINWLLEKYIFDRDDELIAEIKRQGHQYKVVDYLKFQPQKTADYFAPDNCVLFRGSLNLGREILRTCPWTPGAYMDEQALNCLNYYTYLGQYLLNQRYMILPLAELMRQKWDVLNYLEVGESVFIRPVSNMKKFHAGVFDIELKYAELPQLLSLLRAEPTTVVLVAAPKPIVREWRFFMYKDQIITGSQYLFFDNEEHKLVEESDTFLTSYVEEVMAKVNWYPEKLWSLDICELKNQNLYVLEIGSYSCAGEYGCDLSKYVEYGAIAAMEDWRENNE